MSLTLGATSKRFQITPRLLDYGYYYIQFNGSMFTADKYNGSAHWDNVTVTKEGEYIRDTTASVEGYFLIKQCDLVAKIQGGMGRAAAYSGM